MWRFVLVLITALIALVAPVSLARQANAGSFSTKIFELRATDEVMLRGHAMVPNGTGPFPAIVLSSSWGLNHLEYVVPASRFASAGYVVVSYTTRGFWESGGEIDVAGPKDVADARSVIDWTLANTPADASKIGMAGVSYGSGISMLTAAADKRVRAVAAMSTWGDLRPAMLSNETWSQQAIGLLSLLGQLAGRPGPEMRAAMDGYARNDRAGVKPFATPRSPTAQIDRLNANEPAVLITNGWSDSLFPPGQVLELYQKLTGPKRLELVPGDHATPELTGLFGMPNETWDSVQRWFDRYLRGIYNGVDSEHPVRLRPTLGGAWYTYPSLQAFNGNEIGLRLGDLDPVVDRTGTLTQQRNSVLDHTVFAGVDTVANGGTAILTGGAEQLGIPQYVWLPAVLRTNAGVWQTEQFGAAKTVRGTPKLRLSVTPSSSKLTLIAYLYDTDWAGNGQLITHQPYTLLTATPGAARSIEFPLDPILHTVAAGRRLALVVDTMDGLYRGESTMGTSVHLGSPTSDPSVLTLPMG